LVCPLLQRLQRSARKSGVFDAGMTVGEAQRLRQLEDENGRLKKLVADLSLDKEMLKAVIEKNGWSS
jgi:hypothetical protein